MKLTLRTIAVLLTAAWVPLLTALPAFAESKTTRPVMVSATIPMMLQIERMALPQNDGPMQPAYRVSERKTLTITNSHQALTNEDASLTNETRRSPQGQLIRLYTSVTR